MAIYIILLSFSGAGCAFIIVKNFLRYEKNLQNGGAEKPVNYSIFVEIEKKIIIPAKNFFDARITPLIYKRAEKIIRKSRIYILKIENKILKFNNYIQGKRALQDNGKTSEYVKKLNGFKKDEDNNN